MFPITKKVIINGKTYEYVQIIESYRLGKKIKQRIIYSLGRKEKIDPARVDALINNLEQFSLKLIVLRNDNPEIRIAWSKAFGLPLLYKKIWERVGLADLIDKLSKRYKTQFNIEKALFCLVLNRLMEPRSELGVNSWKDGVFLRDRSFTKLKLQHFYRTLDILQKEKTFVEKQLFAKTQSLFNTNVSLVFFDTTSTYFEGTGKRSQRLLNYGYSKDHRPDRQQIIVGVLLDQQGIPIGCEVSPGNHTDATIIKNLVKKVQRRFNLQNIIWVSDQGMASEKNIKPLNQLGYQFILGARMRNVKELYTKIENKRTRKKIFNSMISIKNQGQEKKDLRFYEFASSKHPNRRYLIVYNKQEAKRERKIRVAIIARLKKQLKLKPGIKNFIKHKKYRRYLNIPANKDKGLRVSLDQEKIKKDALYDGFFVLQSDTKLAPEQIIQRYKDLYQIEQAFRNLKSRLDLRPIYHHKDRRIIGHVFVNFLALYLQIILKKLLNEKGLNGTEIHKGLSDLKKIEMTRVHLKEHTYYVRTEFQGKAYRLYRLLRISAGKRIQKV